MRVLNPKDGTLVRKSLPIARKPSSANSPMPRTRRRSGLPRRWVTGCRRLSASRDAVARERDELALMLTREMGKPITQARNELNATRRSAQFLPAANRTRAHTGGRVPGRQYDGAD